jgi:hypothetical protein
LTTTGDLSACKSKRTLIQLLTVNTGAPWSGFAFDLSACKRQCIKCPCRGEQVWRWRAHEGLEGASSLERGGASPEVATDPRARRNLARGGDRPSSEKEPHPRVRPALERGGGLPVRCCAPRAKQSSARGWLGRLSGGSLGPPGSWAREFALRVFWVRLRFVFCFLRR